MRIPSGGTLDAPTSYVVIDLLCLPEHREISKPGTRVVRSAASTSREFRLTGKTATTGETAVDLGLDGAGLPALRWQAQPAVKGLMSPLEGNAVRPRRV